MPNLLDSLYINKVKKEIQWYLEIIFVVSFYGNAIYNQLKLVNQFIVIGIFFVSPWVLFIVRITNFENVLSEHQRRFCTT